MAILENTIAAEPAPSAGAARRRPSQYRHVPAGRAPAGHLPLRTTAAGRVILAFSDSAATPGDLARIRLDHVAYAAEDVAAPVFGRDGTLVAAIAVVAPAGTDLRGFAMAVRTSALGITRTLTAGT